MKKRKYLHRLAGIILLGLILPVVLFFVFFREYALDKIEQGNEDFYEQALGTYASLLDRKMGELEMFAAEISAKSREYDSELSEGADRLTENAYYLYTAVNELRDSYSRSDVSEWGIYFYDTDKIITPEHSYSLDHFLYKYTGQSSADAGCADFFSEKRYTARSRIFDTTNTAEDENGYLLVGFCTRIGVKNDRALVFCVISPKDISKSLVMAGGEGITYYLLHTADDHVLLRWGDDPGEQAETILHAEEWQRVSGVKQKVLYVMGSSDPQLSVTAYISQNSMQNELIRRAVGLRRLLLGTIVVLLMISIAAIVVSYKPMYELIREMDYSGGSEFETIRSTLGSKDSRIVEQEMMILDLLVNHLIYGVPISEECIKRLGIGEDVRYYCVFVMEGCFLNHNETEQLVQELEKNRDKRVFVTDWHEENCSVAIALLKKEDISELEVTLTEWLTEQRAGECALYTGKVVDRMENIQASFRLCLGQMRKKNGKRSKPDTATSKEEQQRKLKEEIQAYLEIHYRDPNLSQVQVADLFQISNYTLSRLFKNQVGVGFTEYLAAKRLEYAKELLLTTGYSVKEIAAMAGFSSENYFSRVFKLYEGISPSFFRKK